ncbi:TonB-dependent receptor [Flavobacterium sp.]|uniref:TonB-dependent receptor n=1 Tax=Flavobacterium sp. TaxID=239 RepID=UPI001B446F4C|nr:TonB-dependent receptor [Flavobacterium sp.]MBP6181072.1 TonB-dependent receptor [Flavobacterium sp.]
MKTTQFIRILILVVGFSFSATSLAQEGKIQGTVTDSKGLVLAGSSIVIEGNNKSSSTDANGDFTINNVANGSYQIVVSYIGFITRKVTVKVPQTSKLSIALQDDQAALDEVVVTGVFDKRTRMQSSVAISTMNAKQIERTAATSAGDLLKNVPGVYVNQARGEIQNTVYSRGISAGSIDNANGYYYVSMQEDGLPVTNLNLGVDYFLRPDAGTAKIEAVKGGTASILGANAPGGIFNYVSKEGGSKFAGEVRSKFGLEGNFKNPYYRTDLNLGGPMNKSGSLTYNLSGFYRESDGARALGYPMNNGGQVRANIVNKYKNGTIKVYAKILDDKNAVAEFTPTIGWNDPKIPAGFSSTDSYYLPKMTLEIPINDTSTRTFKSTDKIHTQQKSVGLNWSHNLGNGFTLKNDARLQKNDITVNTPSVVTPFATDGLLFYAIPHLLGKTGTYSFTDRVTGQLLGTVTQSPRIINGNFAGFNFTPGANNNFPGANVQANSLFYLNIFFSETKRNEFMDNFTISKKVKNMNFILGGFYGNSKVDRIGGPQNFGIGVGTMQHQPHLVDITLVRADGKTYEVTNPEGVQVVGARGAYIASFRQIQASAFFGHDWKISDRLNFDWGIRYESLNVAGFNSVPVANVESAGLDNDPLTIYDNFGGTQGAPLNIDNTVKTVSFSGGLNYKLSDNQAVYVRYTNGKKSPDINFYLNQTSQFLVDNTKAYAQKVEQIEAGYKISTPKVKVFVTPFLSLLSNVATSQTFTNADGSYYNPLNQFNSFKTYGVELESNFTITNQFAVRVGATAQNSKATTYTTWIANANGSSDDVLLDLSGNETDNNAKLIFNINPSYNLNKFYSSLNVSYMGSRQANVHNAFKMPAFTTLDMTFGYDFNKKFGLQANVNNILNTYGVMGWSGPGGFPAALNRQGFTKAYVEANPNAVYSTQGSMPRAFFLTASYKF